nr:hypothetical protein [Tanacetum cinerariifolium]
MLNKENYVPWLSRLLRYAKSRPNGMLIHNSILNGPYVRRMIPEPDDELSDKELKQIKADDQAIQTILLSLPEDIYAAVDTPHQDQSSFNQNYLQQPMPNPEDITNPTTAMNMALALMAKAFKLNYSSPTNNNQRISSNPRNSQIAQPSMNMSQDRQMQMVGGNGGNQFRKFAGHNAGNLTGYNDVQNMGNQNQIGNGNLVAARAKGNAYRQTGNQIRYYNCRGKEEAGIQLQAEEYDLMAAAADLEEIKEVNENCILMANLMTIKTHNWSSFAHQELHKIVRDENFPIVNQVDARVQNFKIQFLKEATKFVGDFKSLTKEADESLTKDKALELEIERLLKAVVSQDIISVVQNESVVDTSDL